MHVFFLLYSSEITILVQILKKFVTDTVCERKQKQKIQNDHCSISTSQKMRLMTIFWTMDYLTRPARIQYSL